MTVERPVIRNLATLVADVRGELRDAIDLINTMPPTERGDVVLRVQSKLRNAMELLTGSRE